MALVTSTWDEFTNQYPLTKTLRFELKPVGKTLEHINKKNLIEKDEQRAKDFDAVKLILDGYYKHFIEEALETVIIPEESLKKTRDTYEALKKDKRNEKLRKDYASLQAQLRKIVHKEIKQREEFNHLFDAKLFKDILPEWLEKQGKEAELEEIKKFNKWTTYFTGFFENRKNVFSEKEIATSITYRIVNDNLPKFLDDLERFEKLRKIKEFDYAEVERNFKAELNGRTLKEFFTLTNYANCLNQKGIELFNLVIGGRKEKEKKSVKGLNQLVNEFAQPKEKSEKQKIRKLQLTPLFKQILSDRESASSYYEKFEENGEVFQAIDEFYVKLNDETLEKLEEKLGELREADLQEVYLKNDRRLTEISKDAFGDWEKIETALKEYAKTELEKNTDKKLEKWMKSKYFSIKEIEAALKKAEVKEEHPICDYFDQIEKKIENKKVGLIPNIREKHREYLQIKDKTTKLSSEKQKKNVEKIKALLDAIIQLYHFVKPLHLNFRNKTEEKQADALDTDSGFYKDFDEIFNELAEIIPIYNKVRNYVTQKPFSTKKFKLNFESSYLLSGWASDFGTHSGLILKKTVENKENYYLAITSSEKLSSEEIEKIYDIQKEDQKIILMQYDFQKPDNKNIPRLFIRSKGENFAPAVKKYGLPIKEVLKIYDSGYFKTEYKKKDPKKFKKSLIKLIDYFKLGFKSHESYKKYKFKWKKSGEYSNISEFYEDTINSCYNLRFEEINYDNLLNFVKEGKLYLFQIWNKDFSKHSKGRKNLHTIYWNELFSKENLSDVVYKLNGKAEIFYRPKSMERNVTHPKNQKIENKDPIKGKKFSKFKYDLIKNKRYTKDRFFFHCPITLNFKAKDQSKTIHKRVNEYLKKTDEEVFVLGIDRGERHLAYYTLLNSKGEIQEQGSFNVISDDKERKRDYHKKLDEREKERDKARKSWKKIENIKELKDGYLSQIVHKIATLVIEKNAIIVLENLNFGFKRGRFKIEKQVYQKFEKKLIDKLNYLVFKQRKENEIGGALNAYQLTNKFDSFKKLGKQSGIIYYVPAYYTSKIDPKTGFVDLLKPKFESIAKAQDYFKKFEYIKYDAKEDLFEFNFNYSNFIKTKKEETKLSKDNWSIWSNGIKLVGSKDKNGVWNKSKEVEPNNELKELFKKYNIAFEGGNDLTDEITGQTKKEFFEGLIRILKTILRLRNSRANSKEDYVLSCVKGANGEFFDSRKAKDNEPKDADANGAYHIGLKGIMLLERIKANKGKKKLDLLVSRNDFINFAVERSK